MKGWVITLNRKDFVSSFTLNCVTVWNSKIKGLFTSPLLLGGCSVDGHGYSNGFVWVFEKKSEAKEFIKLLNYFKKLSRSLAKEFNKEYYPINLKIEEVKASKIMYADFDQIMESFDGFEEKMRKSAKMLEKSLVRSHKKSIS